MLAAGWSAVTSIATINAMKAKKEIFNANGSRRSKESCLPKRGFGLLVQVDMDQDQETRRKNYWCLVVVFNYGKHR